MNACKTLGIKTVAVYSDADKESKHRHFADEAICIGPAPPLESYLDIDKIIGAAKESGAEAIHPGYGFLAENHLLPERCITEGITFIGPSSESMRLLGNKIESRKVMSKAGVPLVPGMKGGADKISEFEKMAEEIGYPVLIKAAAGGGGKGMRVVESKEQIAEAVAAAKREAASAFGDDSVFLEKYLSKPRHIEFQILADNHGNCIHLFERECSIQRRHQKIIEETPSLALSNSLRKKMGADAVKVAVAGGYSNAGTVEFLLDQDGSYYFLEMNTRIQVEHPITEMVTSVDLVIEQIKIAAGLPLSDSLATVTQKGHAIECRIYAEDGDNNFMPSTGTIVHYNEPGGSGVRVDSGVMMGEKVSINYDPIMAKLIVHASDRESAIAGMVDALKNFSIMGVKTSRSFMIDVLSHPAFVAGDTHTGFIDEHMQGRSNQIKGNQKIAAAIASVLAIQNAGKATDFLGDGESSEFPDPWQTIGRWQIGDSLNE